MMLPYVANRPLAAKREPSPNAFLVIVAVHVAAIAGLMSARMDLPPRITEPPTIIELIRNPPPTPSTNIEKPRSAARLTNAWIDRPAPQVAVPDTDRVTVDTSVPTIDLGPVAGTGAAVIPGIAKPTVTPVHHHARLVTPQSEIKPPYPASKLLTGEEAVLTLRLSIDERGHVVAVDPVGRADRDFLEAARRHLIAHWRYQPATDDGRAIASSLTVTLRFMLDG
jgi:protein TonB